MSSFFRSLFPELTRGASGALSVIALAASTLPTAHAVGVSGQGTWETTLQGRDLDGNLSNGPEAFFDTVLDVTWLADANYAKTTNYPVWPPNSGGLMGWNAATYWAAGLDINGVTGWRLPDVKPVNGSSFNISYSEDGTTDQGFNITSTQSELAHLFYVTLGNKGYVNTSGSYQPGFGLQNSGPFSNLQPTHIWLGVDYDPYPSGHPFHTDQGLQYRTAKYSDFSAWAVHSGDVGIATALPEPEAYALALAGLAVAAVVARKRRQG